MEEVRLVTGHSVYADVMIGDSLEGKVRFADV